MQSETLTPDDLAFLSALEEQLACESSDQRSDERHDLSLAVQIRPADTSRSGEPTLAGVTVNISCGGLLASMPRPACIGDHYRVRLFAADDQPIEVMARCLRCAFVNESTFDVVLRFITPLKSEQLGKPA